MSQARIETDTHAPAAVAAALAPDNTAVIDTEVGDDAVVTTIERASLSSLAATIDDYIVALQVATAVVELADKYQESVDTRADSAGTPHTTHE